LPYYTLLIFATIVAHVDIYLAMFLEFFKILIRKVISAHWLQEARMIKPPCSYAFDLEAKSR